MIDAGLSLVVKSETEKLSSDIRDKITALEQKYQKYHLRRGDLPFERFSSERKEYQLDYMGVPLLVRWGIKRYVSRKIPEVLRMEEHEEEPVYPFGE